MAATIDEAAFQALAHRTGIPMTAEQLQTLRQGYEFMLPMLERIRTPRGRAAEPAHIFVPEQH